MKGLQTLKYPPLTCFSGYTSQKHRLSGEWPFCNTFYSFRTIPGKIMGSPWWTDFILILDIFLMRSSAWSTISPITLWPLMRMWTQPCCVELYLTMFTVCLESGMVVIDSCVCALSCFSHVQLFEIPRIVALQAPLSMVFSRQEYWSGLPCPSPGDLPNPGIKPTSLSVSSICRQVLYYQRHLESHIETVLHVSKWKFWQESYVYPV